MDRGRTDVASNGESWPWLTAATGDRTQIAPVSPQSRPGASCYEVPKSSPKPRIAPLRGAHAPPRVAVGALADCFSTAQYETYSISKRWPARAPTTTREGACAPQASECVPLGEDLGSSLAAGFQIPRRQVPSSAFIARSSTLITKALDRGSLEARDPATFSTRTRCCCIHRLRTRAAFPLASAAKCK
jgi:hypothetical protein